MSDSSSSPLSPLAVGLLSWLVPGAGYLWLGQRARGLTIGITILLLFVLGLLIAGVRVIEVPGYDAAGKPMMVASTSTLAEHWIMLETPLTEIRNKPWSVPQLLVGPTAVAAGAWSVYAARPDATGQPRAVPSHSRVSEIGSLYLSVAGLLNLMAIIDASYRAGHRAA